MGTIRAAAVIKRPSGSASAVIARPGLSASANMAGGKPTQASAVIKRPSASATADINRPGLSAAATISGGKSYPLYDGEYVFTPTQAEQTIETKGFALLENITIAPIPNNYGLITWNGSTLTVS